MTHELNALRAKIDALDTKLLDILAERFLLTQQVGEFKRDHHLPPADHAREHELFDRVQQGAIERGLNPDTIRSIMELVISEVKRNHANLSGASHEK